MPGTSKDGKTSSNAAAKTNSGNRWAASRWAPGKVTILQALGLPWKAQYPQLRANLATQAQSASGNRATEASGGNVTAPASSSERDYWTAVLRGLGAPVTDANIQSLSAWRAKESPWNAQGPDGALFTFNPLNTTLPTSAVTGTVNSVGVKRYATSKDGVYATVQTLLGGYPGIVARLRSGQGICGTNLDGEFRKWSGGDSGYGQVC